MATDIQNSSQKLRVSKIVAKIWLGSDRAILYHYHRSLSLNIHLYKERNEGVPMHTPAVP
ncbi:MAG: hypothetical protein KME12_11065 [Trichocoleus desertorum ATA4-8-CV12]|nr:hypothetical protein [Trichocoleus desertorum ATA4-8-CV12]